MSLPAKRCGRPQCCLFRKRKRESKVLIEEGGEQIDRWLALKEKLDLRNDSGVAGFLLDVYDSCDLLSKAPLCEGVRRIPGKEEGALSASTPLMTADGMCDGDDQLPEESACSGFRDVRIVTERGARDARGLHIDKDR